MSTTSIPAPEGFIRCCGNSTLTINKKCYSTLLTLSLIFSIIAFIILMIYIPSNIKIYKSCRKCHDCEITPVCKNIYIVPLVSLSCAILCYAIVIMIILLQKSNSCTQLDLLIPFFKNNLFIPCLPVPCLMFYYSEKEKSDPCFNFWATETEPSLMFDCPDSNTTQGQFLCSLFSWLLIPFAIVMMIMLPLIWIGKILVVIIKWCYQSSHDAVHNSSFNNHTINCFDCFTFERH